MIGDKDYIHTLWFYFPVLNVRDPGPSNAFYSGLMAYLFPTWTDGKDWHLKALATSWDFSARAYQDPMISWNEMVARAKLDGASLGATGVPPDIIVYRITARTECERISEASLEKPRRAPREPSKRNLDIQSAGLQLYYTHPVPTDVSTTPIYLGAVRGRRPDDERRLLRFDTPGPLANTLLDLDAWANVQVSPPLAPDMRSWIAEGWGYEHRFLYLVTQPVVPIDLRASGSTCSWIAPPQGLSTGAKARLISSGPISRACSSAPNCCRMSMIAGWNRLTLSSTRVTSSSRTKVQRSPSMSLPPLLTWGWSADTMAHVAWICRRPTRRR